MVDSYRVWQEAVQLDVLGQWTGEPLKGPVCLELEILGPSRRTGDLEAYFGAIADAISGCRRRQQPGIVLEDDDDPAPLLPRPRQRAACDPDR